MSCYKSGLAMGTCLNDAELAGLNAGRLSSRDRDRIESHLKNCPTCANKASSLRAADKATAVQNPFQTTKRIEPYDRPQMSDELYQQRKGSARAPLVIEGYEIHHEIHRGGQGIVYKARQLSTNRSVAIKLLSHEDSATDRQKHRFEREVNLASSLHHSNIVTVYDSGLLHGRYYYVMEYVHGQPLDVYLKSTTLNVPQKLKLFTSICGAVSYAHQQGVTHRDLKPGNIIVDARGEPHVLDFGLAKAAGAVMTSGKAVSLTSEFMGTLAYAAPEQTKGDPSLIGTRTDVYSLGLILFEMLTNRHPYPISGDVIKTFQSICESQPVKPSSLADGLGADIDTIVLRALAKDPERRYQTVDDLCRDINHFLAREPIEARRDSFSYMIKSHGVALVRRQKVIAKMVLVLAVTLVCSAGANRAFQEFPWPRQYWEGLLAANLPSGPSPAVPPFHQVRIIAINDQTKDHVDAIAQNLGFDDVSPAPEKWRSLRRLHGRLMAMLADAGAGAVVWDMAFLDTEPYNNDFIAGIERLHKANITPIVTIGMWVEEPSDDFIAPDIREAHVSCAASSIGVDSVVPWRVELIVRRGKNSRMMGLSLAGVCAWRYRQLDPFPQLNPESETLDIYYFPRGPQPRRTIASAQECDTILLSTVRTIIDVEEDEWDVGIKKGDVVGDYILHLPDDQTLAKATIPYHDVFQADPKQLRQWFNGKLVIIGDLRTVLPNNHPPDWHRTPDGRKLSGVHAHAIAADALLREVRSTRYPRGLGYLSLTALAALLGVIAARGTRQRKIIGLAFVFLLIVLIGVFSYWQFRYLINPAVTALPVIVAFAGAILIDRVASHSPEQLSDREPKSAAA